MSNSKNKLVVVLSRNYATGLNVIRSLGTAGYTVDLVASSLKAGNAVIAASSKYVNNYVETVSKKIRCAEDEVLVDALLEYAGKYDYKPVLFPTDDYTAAVMDLNRSRLNDIFIMPEVIDGTNGSLVACMNKIRQAELAENAGFKTIKSWAIDLSGKIVIPEDMTYPCFCKPIEGMSGFKKEIFVCQNEDELKGNLDIFRLRQSDRSVLVQEYLKIDKEIVFSGVSLDQNIIIPAIINKTATSKHEEGVTLAGVVASVDELGALKDKAIELMKSFHYTGMFDMELIVSGNEVYFNEINMRCGRPSYAYFMCGVNLPELYVKSVYGEPYSLDELKIEGYGKRVVSEKVAWEDYVHGHITKKEMEKFISDADIKIVENEDDPEPYKEFMKKVKKAAGRSKLRKVKHAVLPTMRSVYHVVAGYPQTKKKNMRDESDVNPRVLVIGRNYCSNLCIARAVGRAGYDVEVLRIFTFRPKLKQLTKRLKPDAYSKYVKAYHVCVARGSSERIVKRLLSIADPHHKMLVIPADDLVANIIDDNLDMLKEHFLLPSINGKAGEINRMMSKDVQKAAAIKAGLPVVSSTLIRTENGKFEIPDTVNYPCFIKPNISKNGLKSKMRKCESEQELREALIELSEKKDVEMLVEDYIEIGKEYSLLGVCTKDGTIGPGFFRAEEGGHNERRGIALTGRVLPCSDYQELIDNLIRFLETLEYEGLYDIDLIETVDGKMYFVEANMRFGGSGYAITGSGVNLPGMYADYMIKKKPVDKNCKVEQPGKLFLSERVMLGEYIDGFISWSDMKKLLKKTDIHFIEDGEDTEPYKHFKKFYFIAFLSRSYRVIKALLGK